MISTVCGTFYSGRGSSWYRKIGKANAPDFVGSVPIPLVALVAVSVSFSVGFHTAVLTLLIAPLLRPRAGIGYTDNSSFYCC